MKRIALLVICMSFQLMSFAQDGVGIGTLNPHSSSILHIYSANKNKGVLLPNSSPTKLASIASTARDGLVMYDSVNHQLVYFHNNKWNVATPWVTDVVDNTNSVDWIYADYNVGIGITSVPTATLEVGGTIKASGNISTTATMNAGQFAGLGVVPIGGIIMWSGNIGAVPADYALCNGQTKNGRTTPNLVGKFIVGSSGTDGSGGNNSLSTTKITYQKVTEYTIDEAAGCSPFAYKYSGTYTISGSCSNNGQTRSFSGIAASSCQEAANAHFSTLTGTGYTNCGAGFASGCSFSANGDYYMTKAACKTDNYTEVDVVTATNNQPAFYQLAYIMRVQ